MTTTTSGKARIQMVDPQTIKRWMDQGEAVVYDVREQNEYAAEHIAGTTLVPLSSFDPSRIQAAGSRKIVLHCRSGNRCGQAAERLAQAGYAGDLYRMSGGIIGWREAGLPTKAGG
ncbi:MAG: rhodanese-like domain-containing protein [Alphaproteobacteria bacterium]|nr:rhodanese-like domain-containing protein [Alphaproteobacteria bacterium]